MGWRPQLLSALRDQLHLGLSQRASRTWGLGPPPSGSGRGSLHGAGLGYHLTGEPSKAQIVENG